MRALPLARGGFEVMKGSYQLLSRHGDADLVAISVTERWTAQDLRRHAAALASQLPPGREGAEALVLCADRYCFAVSALAAWEAGYSIALPPNAQPETVREMLGSADRLLLHDGGWSDGLDVRGVVTDRAASTPTCAVEFRYPGNRKLATVYTSGSTGERRPYPKAAHQLLGEAELLGRLLEIGARDRVLATVPSQHIYGLLAGVLVPLTHGASMVVGTPLHAEEVSARVREGGATVLVSVPAHLRGLSVLGDSGLAGVRLIVSSGAPLESDTASRLDRFSARVTEILGSTETGGMALRDPPSPTWRPMPGIRVAADADGQLLLDSPFLDAGAARPFTCGDRIELDGSGGFKHLGRTDGVVKIAGKRASVSEIEQRLRAVSGVLDAAVAAVPVEGGRGHEIWAAVVAPGLDAEAIRAQLRAWLDPVVLPRRLRLVADLGREATGKLSRQGLLALLDSAPAEKAPVRTELDQKSHTSGIEGGVERHEISLGVREDLVYFRGHFTGHPILPGVVLLNNIVVAETQRAWPDLPGLRRVERLKFRRPIQPRETVTVHLARRRPELSVEFKAFSEGLECNQGTLIFGDPA